MNTNENKQPRIKKNSKKCPRCKKQYTGYPAISRRDNKTKICSECGTEEALIEFQNYQELRWMIN